MTERLLIIGGSGLKLLAESPDGSRREVTIKDNGSLVVEGVDVVTEADDGFEELVYDSVGKVTNIITWTDNTKVQKMHEETITYTGGKVSQVVTDYYNTEGTKIKTITETLSYTGNKVSGLERTVT